MEKNGAYLKDTVLCIVISKKRNIFNHNNKNNKMTIAVENFANQNFGDFHNFASIQFV